MRCSTLRGTFCSLITLATPRQDWTGSNPSRREGGGCGFTLSRSHSCCAVRPVYIQISPGHIWTTLYYTDYAIPAAFKNVGVSKLRRGKDCFFRSILQRPAYPQPMLVSLWNIMRHCFTQRPTETPVNSKMALHMANRKRLFSFSKFWNDVYPSYVFTTDSSEKAKSLEIHKKLLGSPDHFLETYRENVSFHYILSVPDLLDIRVMNIHKYERHPNWLPSEIMSSYADVTNALHT